MHVLGLIVWTGKISCLLFPGEDQLPSLSFLQLLIVVCLELRKYLEASFCCCLFLWGFGGSLLLLLLLLLFWDRVSHWTRSSPNSLSLSIARRSTCLHLASIGITNVIHGYRCVLLYAALLKHLVLGLNSCLMLTRQALYWLSCILPL